MHHKNLKLSFGILVYVSILMSCGHPMNQQTVHPDTGSLTTSDVGSAQKPAVASAKPVHSTFENDCNSKRGIKTIQNEDGSKSLLLHSFCIKEATAEYDETAQTMHFKGTADFEGFRNLNSYAFDVTGVIAKGRGILRVVDIVSVDSVSNSNSNSKNPEFVAAAFCNQPNLTDAKVSCASFFIDLYVKVPGFETLLFDEQVEDCGKADQCLSVQNTPQNTTTEKKSTDNVVTQKTTTLKVLPVVVSVGASPPSSPDIASDLSPSLLAPVLPSAPIATSPKDSVSKVQETPPVLVAAPDVKIAAVDIDAPTPDDLDVNIDDAEEEGADLPDTPAPYVALNTGNKINSLLELFNAKSKTSDSIWNEPADDSHKPEAPRNTKIPPVKKPATPKSPSPAKNSTPVKAPALPSGSSENATRLPDPINLAIAQNEFPFNISVPTRGPMQVYGGGKNGSLVNATELSEPAEGEPQTFVIDTNTKNLKNRIYRKTFGAFYTVDFLKKLADYTYGLLHHPIRINDISLQKGGHLSPHSWHRVGLDADIEYSLIPQDIVHQMTAEQKWIIFQRVGASPLVNGIFVDLKDKRAACQIANLRKDYDPTSRLTMRKLKVEAGHRTHFHINFGCTYNEHCNQKEDELRNQYDKNETDCLAFKMTESSARLTSKK